MNFNLYKRKNKKISTQFRNTFIIGVKLFLYYRHSLKIILRLNIEFKTFI